MQVTLKGNVITLHGANNTAAMSHGQFELRPQTPELTCESATLITPLGYRKYAVLFDCRAGKWLAYSLFRDPLPVCRRPN